MKSYDVVIIGAGLAGLQCAKLLAQRSAKFCLLTAKRICRKAFTRPEFLFAKRLKILNFRPRRLGNRLEMSRFIRRN